MGLALAAALAVALAGCRAQQEPAAETTIFAMDTVMTLTLYGKDRAACQAALEEGVETIYDLDHTLSVTREGSDLWRLNHSQGEPVEVDPETAQVLTEALALCRVTDGALDVTAYPAVAAWGFTTGDYRVPDQEELDRLAAAIDWSQVSVSADGQVTLPAGMELDLGAVAKGYAGDLLAQIMADHGVTSALLNLGQSTIQAVGVRPDGAPWRIGLQDPDGESYLGVLELTDQALGVSGGYQRYFEQDGVRYWHILDPNTAAPARSGLTSVAVVGKSGAVCDGLSTALFVMGLEEGAAFWRAHPELEIDVIFLTEDGGIYLTAGLEDSFTLAQGYEGREVTVLK
jgi:thiamine biosynthesis lipoprotein